MDALQVIAGTFLFLGFSLLLRRRVNEIRPSHAVLLVTLINEAAEVWVDQWPSVATQFGEAIKDIVVTLLVPTLSAHCSPPATVVRAQGQ